MSESSESPSAPLPGPVPAPAAVSASAVQDHLARFSLEGRVVLVTGASRGLGFEIARAMAGAGARVLLNGRDADRLQAAIERIGPTPLAPEALAFDVADQASLEQAFDTIEARHGQLDVLVSNVGVRDRRPFDAFDAGAIRALLETDLVAAMLLAQRAARLMRAHGGGRLITVTSIAGLFGRANDALYTAAKHGLTGMVRALAAEYGRHGITSNAIAPGGFRTEHNAEAYSDPAVRRHFETRTPLARWGEPPEIAGAAVFLASAAGAYVNGHVLVVDGGMTAAM